ncbi:hypothetical protein AAVH_04586 [Aphelenchoides avenae]|nr:hypothetical protein AAVH_04586 [Aphelenchus avenae]
MFGTLIDAPTSASPNAECSTSSTSQRSETRKNVCLLVNDDGDRVFRGLTECSKVGLEDGALAPVESDADGRWRAFDLHIDNKYYATDVTVVSAASCEGVDAWRKKHPKCAVPALIVRVQTNSPSVLTLLADVEQRLGNLQPEAKAIVVCGPQSSACGFVPSESENLYESELNVFCDRQHFEFIELEPNEDVQNILVNEYRENIGIARVWELLETAEWPERLVKPNPHRGNPRPKNDLDYREDDWPNSEDEGIAS